MTAPIAKTLPHELEAFGDIRQDPYFWMRHREDPDVLAYVQAENAYTEETMRPLEGLVDTVYQEILGRLKQTDSSVPVRDRGYYYYSRTVEGLQYPISARKKASLEAAEEILLDQNEMAAGHPFFSVGASTVSPDSRLLAYSTDTTGYREYTLRIREIATGLELPDSIARTSGIVWAEDGKTILYTMQQPQSKRAYQLWKHELGQPSSADVLLYEEKDERFQIGIGKTLSKKFLVLTIQSGLTSEMRYVDAKTPEAHFQVLIPRREGISYHASHHNEHFYIRINDQGRDFRVVRTPVSSTAEQNWVEVIAAQKGRYVEGMILFANYAAYLLRVDGLHTLRIVHLADNTSHDIQFEETAYSLHFGANAEFDSQLLRFGYSSMVTPQSTFDYDMQSRERTLLKQQEVLGGYDPGAYAVERVQATSADGTVVPISIAYKKGFVKDGQAPLLLYGYGAYAIPMDPGFSATRLSLLDRGFAYAIAHIRGGTDLGYSWYEDGKLLKKKNSFQDFIACAEFLIAKNYTNPKQLVIEGGSAGGLLVGAVMNERPELFQAVIAGVPFVDVVSSLQDKSIPLSTTDADEFGDPEQQEFYEYMKSYSPYDNVRPVAYPNLYVFGGMNDSQVVYWEPVKWVAKLRAHQQGSNQILMHMNIDAGHGGASGRYDRMKELARSYAFAIAAVGRHQ
ncbi:S9 family peptidase [Bryobacter aggregatus]|uniref:S9 family peptidase n=1 Tax=Bryobacter aggregatus TaxID=360054 RepID=UPI0004E18FE4|nr:oligopeptidase B [Bryobacter aggregatus]